MGKTDTIQLIASSIKDIVFSQRAPETKLVVTPGVPAEMSKDAASHSNGVNGISSRFDPTFTDSVINAVGPNANPRLAHIMNSLTKHLHDWVR